MHRWLVPLWVLLLPVQIEVPGFPIPRFAPADLVLLAYIPSFLTKGWRATRGFWHNSITALALCFLLGNIVYFVSTGEVNRWALLNKTVGVFVLMLSYSMVGVYASDSWDRVHQLTKLFVRVVTLHALVAMLLMATGLSTTFHANWMGGLRLAGFMVDPNAFGGLLVAAFLVAVVVYFRRGALFRPFEGVISCSILAVGTFLTYSRSCLVGLVAGTALAFLFGEVRHRALSIVVILALGGVLYYAVPAVLGSGAERDPWEHSEHMYSRQGTVDARFEMMSDAMHLFWESPVWGRGLGYYQYWRGGREIIHNTFAWILAEMGLLGMAAFIWFALGHLRRAVMNIWRGIESARPTSIGLLCGFVALLAFSVGIEALNQRHWWFIMALISSGYLLTTTWRQEEVPVGEHLSETLEVDG